MNITITPKIHSSLLLYLQANNDLDSVTVDLFAFFTIFNKEDHLIHIFLALLWPGNHWSDFFQHNYFDIRSSGYIY